MPKANEIKKGMAVTHNGKLLLVKDIDVQSPSARGAATLYKMRFTDVRTGMKVEERFKGDEIIDAISLSRRSVTFSYIDGDEYVFMDDEDYTPYAFKKEQIEEELLFIPEGAFPVSRCSPWTDRCWRLNCLRRLTWKLWTPRPELKARRPAHAQSLPG